MEIVPGTVHRESDFGLHPEIIEALWKMEDRHFWHAARNAWVRHALAHYGLAPDARFLEVGCGSGAVAGALCRAGYAVTGIDTALPLVQRAEQRLPDVDWIVGEVGRLATTSRLPFAGIGFFDVLEHLDDPAKLLLETLPLAEPGALVFVTVPADRSLFSAVDDVAGHKKRYELDELTTLLTEVGLRDVVEHGLFRALWPAQRLARRTTARSAEELNEDERAALMQDDLAVPFAPLNAAMGWVCEFERRFAFTRSVGRIGASLLAVARHGAN